MKKVLTPTNDLIFYLFALTSFFLVGEITFLFNFSGFYFADFKLVNHHLNISAHVLPAIFYFIFAQLVLHIGFTIAIWVIMYLLSVALAVKKQTSNKIAFSLWAYSILCLLICNAYFFPNSKFTIVTSFLPDYLIRNFFNLIKISWTFILAISLMGLVKLLYSQRSFLLAFILILTLILFSVLEFNKKNYVIKDSATIKKPNIIIVGMDAVRPDFLNFFGHSEIAPHVDSFLNHSFVAVNAVTPIARTFPAWISILSGKYPYNNGIRTDLANTNHLDMSENLSSILHQHGYKTIYASDETRFSNIDKNFGFDAIVTPPMGFNDFLLGSLNDFPLSNLVINTLMGRWLFPYSYGNRAAFITYEPNSFLNLIQSEIKKPRNAPIFLAVHFCLPHLPYIWASFAADGQPVKDYQAAITAVDKQFQDFLNILNENKILNHAMIVLLSDHGEAFGLPGDRITESALIRTNLKRSFKIPNFYPKGSNTEQINESIGHGTDILSLSQYHCLLAMKTYGLDFTNEGIFPQLMSLIQIKPTILEYLNISYHSDGASILSFLKNSKLEKTNLISKDLFIESDFSPMAVLSTHPELRNVLLTSIDYFKMNRLTTKLEVKNKMSDLINSSKQLGDLYGHWFLAYYPQKNNKYFAILVDLNTGYWTMDLQSTFAKNAPVNHMQQALMHFFKKNFPLL